MRILFHHWVSSFHFFSPQSLKTNLIRSAWVYGTALSLLFKYFYWILLGEILIFITLVSSLTGQNIQKGGTISVTPGFLIASFVLGISGLILNSALLLFIRKEEPFSPAIPYFKYYFFRYLQFSLFVFAITLFCLCMLFGLGITKVPAIPAPLALSVKIVELLAMFFWLDSSFSFKNIFVALENAVNLLVYNLPIFITLLFAWWGIEQGIMWLIFDPSGSSTLPSVTISQRIEIANMVQHGASTSALVALKYLRFVFEYLWISIIFCVYKLRRDTRYTTSLFDQEQSHD